jgi:hypothetical protein
MDRQERADRAAASGVLTRREVDDIGLVLEDIGYGLDGVMDDLGEISRTHAPSLLGKMESLMHHGFGPHIPNHHQHSLHNMLERFHAVVERSLHLERELAAMQDTSNVVVSTPIDNLAAATTSANCTFGAPYSGIEFMICEMLMPAELTNFGGFGSLQFAGIDFATPSTSANVVTYDQVAGVLGAPLTKRMGFSVFYTNKTMPSHHRRFCPWTGWIFDPSAKITFNVFNPTAFAQSYSIDWLMRSNPCTEAYQEGSRDMAYHLQSHDAQHSFDMMHHFVLGMGNATPGRRATAPTRRASHSGGSPRGGGVANVSRIQ